MGSTTNTVKTETALKNAIGYIRVSTEAQSGDDRYGVSAQKKGILDYAAANGYRVVQWFQDEISGTAEERPELDKILYGELFSNPPIEAVIAFKSDRVARNTKLYFYYLFVLEKRNIKLISAEEVFPEGDFANIYRALMMFVAEQERKNIALRTRKGKSMKAVSGGFSGGRTPYGYKAVNGRMEIDEPEREIVRLVFEKKKADGMRNVRIAEWLNRNGYHTRSNGSFNESNIRSILNNEPTYRGLYQYGHAKNKTTGEPIPWVRGVHEPILMSGEFI